MRRPWCLYLLLVLSKPQHSTPGWTWPMSCSCRWWRSARPSPGPESSTGDNLPYKIPERRPWKRAKIVAFSAVKIFLFEFFREITFWVNFPWNRHGGVTVVNFFVCLCFFSFAGLKMVKKVAFPPRIKDFFRETTFSSKISLFFRDFVDKILCLCLFCLRFFSFANELSWKIWNQNISVF